VVLIGLVEDIPAVFFCGEVPGAGQLVQFLPERIGGDPEFLCQFPEVGPCRGIEEKTGEEFYPHLGSHKA